MQRGAINLTLPVASPARLNHTQPVDQEFVEVDPIRAEVRTAMTVGTNSNDIFWVIWAAIGKSMNMVALDVPTLVGPLKRASVPAVFAFSLRSCQDVISYVPASRVNGAVRGVSLWSWLGRFVRSAPKLIKVDLVVRDYWVDVIDVVGDVADAPKFENNGISYVVLPVGCRAYVMAFIHHLTFISQPTNNGREKVDRFTAFPGVDDRAIPSLHHHMAFLTLAEVLKHAIWSPTVYIAVFVALFAANKENDGSVCRRDDAAASLPIVDAMDIRGAVVNLANNKRHLVRSPVMLALIGCGPFRNVKEAA